MKISHPDKPYQDCGPSALSIFFGKSVNYWSRKILEYRKTHKPYGYSKREVPKTTVATFNSEIAAMVRTVYPKARFKFLKSKLIARRWVWTVDPKKTYLVSLMHHMCVYHNGHFYDNVDFYKSPEVFRCKYDVVEAYMEFDNYEKYKPTKMEKDLDRRRCRRDCFDIEEERITQFAGE